MEARPTTFWWGKYLYRTCTGDFHRYRYPTGSLPVSQKFRAETTRSCYICYTTLIKYLQPNVVYCL